MRGLCSSGVIYEGNLCFKTIGLAYSWKEITVFALFHFVFEGKFHVEAPGGLHLERRFNRGFFVLQVWGAYTRRGLFSEFYSICKRT